ncbi:hypothetical protein MuYL_3706 [Mucilaginibacter xinganensis]|uniref:Uncharacterized protein n=1 Tax=Mucilaginibacter xinganensis TaxID=1234841 RepID=A0A223P180_9SPHI|nr:hypothetical protein MuYL_3706 [Mucilaginibacter xinganensis]
MILLSSWRWFSSIYFIDEQFSGMLSYPGHNAKNESKNGKYFRRDPIKHISTKKERSINYLE